VRAHALQNFATCEALQGKPRRALARLDQAAAGDAGNLNAPSRALRALALQRAGRAAAARRELAAALKAAESSGHRGVLTRTLIPGIELCLLRKDVPAARRSIRRLTGLARRAEFRFLAGLAQSYAVRCSPGARVTAAGVRRTVAAYAAAGHRQYEFLCRRNFATAALARGDAPQAAHLLRGAARRAAALGFSVLAAELRRLDRITG